MSPNLSSEHFKQNQILYEKVLMSIFSLTGISRQLTEEAESSFKSVVSDALSHHRSFLDPVRPIRTHWSTPETSTSLLSFVSRTSVILVMKLPNVSCADTV